MNRRVLFCATVDIHFKAFHLPYLKWFKEQGWEVHVAASGDMKLPFVDEKYNIPIERSPLNNKNLKAYKVLKKIIEDNQYKIIHCHTPMGGVLARLAARKARKYGTKVIYTAHGFHFCKDAPLTNWLLFFPIEKYLSNFTDCLITINDEDYSLAKNHQFKAKIIEHVHGVGVNTDRYFPVEQFNKYVLRSEFGYKKEDFLMFYAAEFNKNKNQKLLIESLALIKNDAPNARLLLAGEGELLQECQEHAKRLGIEKEINFLGYRNDIEMLLKMSDIAVGASLREGLPVNIIEAMACGKPIVASVNRGHSELVQNGINGYVVPQRNSRDFSQKLLELYNSIDLCEKMGVESSKKVKKYSLFQVSSKLIEIYSRYMVGDSNETKSKHNRAYI